MKIINWILSIGMLVGTLIIVVLYYDSSRLLTYLAIIPVVSVPLLLRKTKFCLNDKEIFYYYVFVFLAEFLGCVVNLYNSIWWFDMVIHFCSGIFAFGVGWFLLNKFYLKDVPFCFKILFSICTVALTAVIWELFEFGADSLLKLDLQHNLDTGVQDTMVDMLMAFVGGIFLGISCFIKKK